MTNIFFQANSAIGRTLFVIGIWLQSATDTFVSFVVNNVLVMRGIPPIKAMNQVLEFMCYCRLNPQDIGANNYCQQLVNQIGVPIWFQALTHLLPTGPIGLKGIFSLQLKAVDVTPYRVQYLQTRLQANLLSVRAYYINNGVDLKSYNIQSDPTKRTEITVFVWPFDTTKGVTPSVTLEYGPIEFWFPSNTGYTHSLSWLFCLLFLPYPIPANKSDRLPLLADATRFFNTNFNASLPWSLIKQLQRNILLWYFDGNTVAAKTPVSQGSGPRNPQTGRQSTGGRGTGRGRGTPQTQPNTVSGQIRPNPPPAGETAVLSQAVRDLIRETVFEIFSNYTPPSASSLFTTPIRV